MWSGSVRGQEHPGASTADRGDDLGAEEDPSEGARLRAVRLMLREESAFLELDSADNAALTFRKMEPWRSALKKAEMEDEEILQTKIVGVQEIRDLELRSLFEEKEALKRITKPEMEQIRKKNPENQILPAKLVITRKAGGRQKIGMRELCDEE